MHPYAVRLECLKLAMARGFTAQNAETAAFLREQVDTMAAIVIGKSVSNPGNSAAAANAAKTDPVDSGKDRRRVAR